MDWLHYDFSPILSFLLFDSRTAEALRTHREGSNSNMLITENMHDIMILSIADYRFILFLL